MKAGRLSWLVKLKSEGKPVPRGRKKGSHNRPAAERERAAREESDGSTHTTRNRKALREQRHQERKLADDLALR
jgi:hypothetical protein